MVWLANPAAARASPGDRKYNAESFMEWLLPFFTTGVFNNCFQVTANNNMTVTVSGGYANIQGRPVVYDSAEIFDLAKASGNMARIDNIVLRRDDTNRDIYITVQTGAFSNNPTPPDLQRENAIYDLKLAEVYIGVGVIVVTQTNITDTRMNADVCGWVMSTVKEIDFTQITAQFDRFFAEYKPRIEEDYNTYAEDIRAFLELYKGYTTARYDEYIEHVETTEGNVDTRYGQYLEYAQNAEGDIDDRYAQYLEHVETTEGNVDDRYEQYLQYTANHETQIDARYQAFITFLNTYKTDSTTAYEALIVWLESFKTDSQADFDEWLENIQGILDDEAAGNLLLMVQELQSQVPSAAIGTIEHGLQCYPAARLYKVEHSAGISGAGEGGAGGGNLISVPAVFELDGYDTITVKVIPEFSLHTEIYRLSANTYGFARAGSNTSLFLILNQEV